MYLLANIGIHLGNAGRSMNGIELVANPRQVTGRPIPARDPFHLYAQIVRPARRAAGVSVQQHGSSDAAACARISTFGVAGEVSDPLGPRGHRNEIEKQPSRRDDLLNAARSCGVAQSAFL